jgi:proliferating cell nuclear antigen
MSNLAKVMKLAGNDDSITLKSEEDTSKLTIIFENPSIYCVNIFLEQGKKTEFAMNLLTLDSEVLGIPDKDYQAKVTTNAGEFTKLCRELYQVAETVNIEASEETITFTVEGDLGKGKVALNSTLGDKAEDKTSIEVKEPVKLAFALRYLNMFNKASSCSPVVSLMLSSETPLVVEYTMDKLGSLKFYLAPKINEEKE